jgi:CheY-like chemotaxis protein
MDPLITGERHAKPPRRVILLVEHDFLTRWTAAEYLRETGFEVIEAVSAAEALAAMRSGSAIDAMFCNVDTALAAGGGELLRCLEQEHRNLPVLLASDAHGSGSLASMPTRASIGKPYSMSDVEQRLKAIMTAR